jgi:hypothetical protein
VVEVERDGWRTRLVLRLGVMPVKLPERLCTPLWLVVIRGFGQEPVLLLTNVAPAKDREHAAFVADVYLTRWKSEGLCECEEAYRFVKQAYRLEDVRVRSYVALRNVYALVTAVLYFVSVVIGTKAKLNLIFKQVCEKAERFYEIATFYQYAVADGIHRLLFGSGTGPLPPGLRVRLRQLLDRFLAGGACVLVHHGRSLLQKRKAGRLCPRTRRAASACPFILRSPAPPRRPRRRSRPAGPGCGIPRCSTSATLAQG